MVVLAGYRVPRLYMGISVILIIGSICARGVIRRMKRREREVLTKEVKKKRWDGREMEEYGVEAKEI